MIGLPSRNPKLKETEAIAHPRPTKFKPAREVTSARICAKPPWIRRKRAKGRFAVGIGYERKVQDHLALLVLGLEQVRYLESPWIEFLTDEGKRWCQLDGLVINHKHRLAIIYEIKWAHCERAWFQLRELYQPVVRKLLPNYTVGLMEVVHWHDPQIQWPEAYDFAETLLGAPHANRIAVHIFNPRRSAGVFIGGRNGSQGSGEAPGAERPPQSAERLAGAAGPGPGGMVQPGCGQVPAGAEGKAAATSSNYPLKGD